MYIVLEIQEAADGSVATLPPVKKESREEAESAFYMVCAAAAVSSVKTHTAMLFTHEGQPLKKECWHHDTQPPATEE